MICRFLATAVLVCCLLPAWSQIVITADDMPVNGDSLRYSSASAMNAISYAADSGDNVVWAYNLAAVSQGLDSYKKPVQVNPMYAFSLDNPTCYGHKIADSIPGLGLLTSGISISDLYRFYGKEVFPPCFAAEAFGASLAGFPAGSNYTYPDVIYMFPLTYGRNDSMGFLLEMGAASMGGLKQEGYRKTRVDGWGTITTPYFTTPTPCIRVRSEIVEVDSITMESMSFGIPRTTVEYKWLVKGEHYPALYVTTLSVAGFEVPLSVRYRDKYRPELNTRVRNLTADKVDVFAYPNPAIDGWVRFEIPDSWQDFYIELFDAQGRLVMGYSNKRQLDVSTLPTGNYLVRLTSGESTSYIKLAR